VKFEIIELFEAILLTFCKTYYKASQPYTTCLCIWCCLYFSSGNSWGFQLLLTWLTTGVS